MSYKSYIGSGVLRGLRHGMIGTPINSVNKIKVKQLHKCLDCPEMIRGGMRKKRCFSCEDKHIGELHNKYHKLRYIKNSKKKKHIYWSKY